MSINCVSYISESKCSKDEYTRCENYNNGNCLSQHELELDLRGQIQYLKKALNDKERMDKINGKRQSK